MIDLTFAYDWCDNVACVNDSESIYVLDYYRLTRMSQLVQTLVYHYYRLRAFRLEISD